MKALILPVLLCGCFSTSQIAICDGTKALRTVAADAVAEDGGPRSLVAVQSLIATIDVGCRDVLP
jgi:hypothetical protein